MSGGKTTSFDQFAFVLSFENQNLLSSTNTKEAKQSWFYELKAAKTADMT